MMKIVIFGCGTISIRIAKSLKLCKNIDFVGFGSKDIAKAKLYCEAFDCQEYGNYEYFLNSDIDAVYIATYNPGHYDLIKQCLKAKKNVICEKPMLSNIAQNNELFELAKANNVVLMEALKSVFLPIIQKVKTMIISQEIGKIIEAKASFMRKEDFSDTHWINDPITGGVLKDLGTYCVGTLNYLFDAVPTIKKIETNKTKIKSDRSTFLDLEYHGVKAKAQMSSEIDGDNYLEVIGSKGLIHIDNFWKTGKGYYVLNNERYELEEELISDFYYELEHFNDLVINHRLESDIMNKEASNNILKITDIK